MLSCVAEATHLQQELREFLPQFGIFGILADGFFEGLVGRLDEGPRVFGILGLFQQEPREFRVDLIVVGAEIEVTRKKLQSLVLSLLLDPEPGQYDKAACISRLLKLVQRIDAANASEGEGDEDQEQAAIDLFHNTFTIRGGLRRKNRFCPGAVGGLPVGGRSDRPNQPF